MLYYQMIPSNDNGNNSTDVAIAASASLANDLLNHVSNDQSAAPSPRLYLTTLTVIFLIHVLFVYQWIRMKNRKDVSVSYVQIIRKKQFHKVIIAALSHPPSGEGTRGIIESRRDHPAADQSTTGTSFEIEYGDEYRNEPVQTRSRFQRFGMFLYSKIRDEVIKPLSIGHLSGLPLLTYISHVMWQCRALEEIFDYNVDIQSEANMRPNFNISTIIERDSIIQNSIRSKVLPKPSRRISQYRLEYYRVLFSLIIASYMLDFFVTHLIVRFAKMHRERLPSNAKNMLESQGRRGICTLTPMCIALIIIYSSHFPHTPISVLPFIDISFLFGKSTDLTFIMTYLILTVLSRKLYPFMGMFYGSLTGLLWTTGLIQFLADEYWGRCYIYLYCFACAASLKAESRDIERRRVNDMFFWLDYVAWDSGGNLL